MKKIATAILVFDLIAGLLFLGLQESGGQIPTAGGAAAQTAADGENADSAAGGETAGSLNVREDKDAADSGYDILDGGNAGLEDVRKIAITFDDGPHPSYTEQLLDGLKERGVHATFFVTGEHAELHPDIIKRMQEDA